MTLIERLKQQALILEQENYHTEAETMREAAVVIEQKDKQLQEFIENLGKEFSSEVIS